MSRKKNNKTSNSRVRERTRPDQRRHGPSPSGAALLTAMTAASDKRRNGSPTSHLSKKRKTAHVSLDNLSWRPVAHAHTAGIELDEGLLDLEEVEGVQVEYEQTANGRVAKFLVRIFS